MVFEMEFSIKIMYIDQFGSNRTDTSTLFYYINSNFSTKNAFEIISNNIKIQLNLDKDEYQYIHYKNGVLNPFINQLQSNTIIYKEFNGESNIPFYIKIFTNESYQSMINFILPECPICMNGISRSNLISPYRCGHRICNDCYHRCILTNHSCCCYCRESGLNENIIV